MTVQGQRSWS